MGEQARTCDCTKCRSAELTGIERAALEQVRSRITDEDRAPALVAGVDEDGMLFLHVPSVDSQLMYLVAKWLWEESVEGEE